VWKYRPPYDWISGCPLLALLDFGTCRQPKANVRRLKIDGRIARDDAAQHPTHTQTKLTLEERGQLAGVRPKLQTQRLEQGFDTLHKAKRQIDSPDAATTLSSVSSSVAPVSSGPSCSPALNLTT